MDSLNIEGLSGNQIMFMVNRVSENENENAQHKQTISVVENSSGTENAQHKQTTSIVESSSGCSSSNTRKVKSGKQKATKKPDTKFRWAPEDDESLLKNIIIEEPYKTKKFSKERKILWDTIAENVNHVIRSGKVTSRGCSERYDTIKSHHKRKRAEEEKASGIAPVEPTECEILLDDLLECEEDVELMRGAEKESENQRKDRERKQAEEMRNRSMESMGETMERDGGRARGKKRKSASGEIVELMEYLKRKSENEKEVRMKETELREVEIENKKRELDLREQELESQRAFMERSYANMEAILQMQQGLMEKLVEKLG